MKKILLICSVLFSISCLSQVPNWSWANCISGSTGNSYDRGVSVATDFNGNIFVLGQFASPTISLSSVNLNNSSSGTDIFLAKYDSSGLLIWAKSFGSSGNDDPTSITTDNLGNILIMGDFWSSTITFGSTTLTNSESYNDIFIVKLDTSGNVLWANKAGGNSQDNSNSIKTDSNRNIIITGSFRSSTIDFGTNSLTNVGSSDTFIAKYDENGDLIWVKRIAGTSFENPNDLTIDSNDNIIITGRFGSTTMSDGTNSLSNTGVSSMFLLKYSSTGDFQWSKYWSGSSLNKGVGVTTDSLNNVILAGNYGDTTINFDGIILNCETTSSAIVKYDYNGNIIWAKTCSEGKYKVNSISSDSFGNIFLSGFTLCPTLYFGISTLINSGGYDAIITKYDSSGNEVFGKYVGGNLDEYGVKVTTDLNNNQILLGSFKSSSLNFGTTVISNAGTGSNSNQIFFSKLNSSILNVENFTLINSFTIYPNPIITEGNLYFNNYQNNSRIEVFDIIGKRVKMTYFSGNNYILERGNLFSGIYIVKITTENNVVSTQKIIIQ